MQQVKSLHLLAHKPLLAGIIAGALAFSSCVRSEELSIPQPPIASAAAATTSTARLSESTASEVEPAPAPQCPEEESATTNPWAEAAASALSHPGFDNVALSASIWVEGYGEIVAHNPDLALFPASNQKLFTAIGALTLLDQDYRFLTTLEATQDSLILRAGGDPSLTSKGVHSLSQLAAAAITELRTSDQTSFDRLVIDAGHFEPATTTLGRQDWQLPTYTGPLSAFVVDDNRWRTDSDFVANPAQENGELLAEELRQVGISIGVVEHHDHYEVSGSVAASVMSQPVGELVRLMMMSSDNEIAESLLRQIGDGSTAAGIAEVDQVLANWCPLVNGESGDGSGLSRANLRSSRDWRQLLQHARSASWGESFVSSLPVAGQSGTMRQRLTGSATAGNVTAKTGTIIGGRALSGFATTVDGYLVVFSIITNSTNGKPGAANASTAAIDNLIAAIVRTSTE